MDDAAAAVISHLVNAVRTVRPVRTLKNGPRGLKKFVPLTMKLVTFFENTIVVVMEDILAPHLSVAELYLPHFTWIC